MGSLLKLEQSTKIHHDVYKPNKLAKEKKMNMTVLNLCNRANAIYYNSEPHSWYTGNEGESIHFENNNTKEIVFTLSSHQPVKDHENGSYAFTLEDLQQTIWIDFYKEVPLLIDDLL